ncbi:MAG: hypothetical protein LUQ12_03860, partial [Methanoregulaceae archaeon]|nr:hypothetical protein [Methanoregulaceae archaeon]
MRTAEILVLALMLATILGAGCTTPSPRQGLPAATPSVTPGSASPVPPEQMVAFVEKAYEFAHDQGK